MELDKDSNQIDNEGELIDKKGLKYDKEKAEKAMIGENDEAQNILNDAREIYVNEIKYRKNIQKVSHKEKDVYLISQQWFKKWKEYVRYQIVKKLVELQIFISK